MKYADIDLQDDAENKRHPFRALVSFLAMLVIALAMLIWVHAIRHGDRTLPFIPLGANPWLRLSYQLSQAVVTWGPLACAISIYASAFALGSARKDWFRRARVIAVVVVGTFAYWVTLSHFNS